MENNLLLEVEKKIITLRNQQVILDSDVAELYGVQTKRINEAVSNNPEKFPEGYVLMLDNQEKTEQRDLLRTESGYVQIQAFSKTRE